MLVGGPPGLGKSQVTVNVAATVSTGGYWPCDEGSAPEGDVIIFSAEDGIADTIIPRLAVLVLVGLMVEAERDVGLWQS